MHAEHALLAAKHGKHVLSEKAMATSATEAKAMVDACNENGVLLGHGTMMRFNASHAKMKEKIDAGELGKLLSVHGIYSVYWDPGVPKDTGKEKDILDLEQGEGRQLAWRQISRLSGGGPLADDGIHAIDTMVYLMGHVAEVASFTDTLTRDRDVEDTATVCLFYTTDAADEGLGVDLGGRRIIKKKNDWRRTQRRTPLRTLQPREVYSKITTTVSKLVEM